MKKRRFDIMRCSRLTMMRLRIITLVQTLGLEYLRRYWQNSGFKLSRESCGTRFSGCLGNHYDWLLRWESHCKQILLRRADKKTAEKHERKRARWTTICDESENSGKIWKWQRKLLENKFRALQKKQKPRSVPGPYVEQIGKFVVNQSPQEFIEQE